MVGIWNKCISNIFEIQKTLCICILIFKKKKRKYFVFIFCVSMYLYLEVLQLQNTFFILWWGEPISFSCMGLDISHPPHAGCVHQQ